MQNKPFLKYREDLKEKARDNRKNPSLAEKMVWNMLKKKQACGYKFQRQKPVGNFILDFYCSELKLAIEIDGKSHEYQEKYDQKRTAKLAESNITVIRYQNDYVIENIDRIYEDLMREIEEIK